MTPKLKNNLNNVFIVGLGVLLVLNFIAALFFHPLIYITLILVFTDGAALVWNSCRAEKNPGSDEGAKL